MSAKPKKDIKDDIKESLLLKNLKPMTHQEAIEDTMKELDEQFKDKTFIIKRKKDDKINKKTFQTVMEASLLKNLDALAKKSGYSRNEMVNMMIDHCVNNFEIED